MPPPRAKCLALATFLAAPALLAADAPPATPSSVTIWRLEQPAQVGGHPASVLGEPRLAKDAAGSSLIFNGSTDGLFVPVNPLAGLAQFTIEVLFKPEPGGLAEQRFFHIQDETGSRGLMEIRLAGDTWALDTFLYSEATKAKCALLDPARRHPAARWTWVALVYANGHMAHYIDGVKELEGDVAFPPMAAGQTSLGVRQNKVFWFKGGIREVRFHPQALAPAALQSTRSP